jgi:hypothetical protein
LDVIFEVNDAQVKDRLLAGVAVTVTAVGADEPAAVGTTGDDGRLRAELVAGTYQVAYGLAGYVPYTSQATEIRSDRQVVTVSLSRLLEATGAAVRQVRIILNWGSDTAHHVRDVDSHLACPCQDPPGHVMYSAKVHEGVDHRVELDVDDTDWGGPETITLTDPPPGEYLYWVHDFSAGPGILGTSDIVVRVVIGDREAGEFRIFKGVDQRAWRPFKHLLVGADLRPSVVPFTADEIAEGLDLQVPPSLQPPDSGLPSDLGEGEGASSGGPA